MDDKSRLIAEYLDGELPLDIVPRFEEALLHDQDLKARYERAKVLRKRLSEDAAGFKSGLDARSSHAHDRVWERLSQRKITEGRAGLWTRRIALPMPLLAALTVAIIGSATMSLALQGGPSPQQPVAELEAAKVFGLEASPVALPPAGSTFSMPLSQKSSGVEITIKVEDLDQLLRLLEGSRSDRDISVQMPGSDVLEALGEPELIKATEQEQ